MRGAWKLAVLCGGVALAGVAAAAEPEELLGFALDAEKGSLSIDVVSSGCTGKGDFLFERQGEVLTIVRKGRDACKAVPGRSRLEFSLKEAGIDPRKPFKLGNRFVAEVFAANMGHAAPR